MIAEAEQTIPGVVALPAVGAGNETADVHALAIKVFGNSKARATTTWNEQHAHRIPFLLAHLQGFSPAVKCAHELEFHPGSNPDPVVDRRNRGGLLERSGFMVTIPGESARWAESLYTRFYEKPGLKTIRDQLDCAAGDATVARLVTVETPALFGYYLDCLRPHKDVVGYIRNTEKGFEYLSQIMSA